MNSNNGSKLIVEATGLNRTYHRGKNEVPALRGVDLRVYAGDFMAVKGRSGSGKTTLLNILGGLDVPNAGVVYLNGRNLADLAEDQMMDVRRHEVGFVFQSFGLLPYYSAYETVEFMLRLSGLSRRARHERTMESLSLVGLEKRLSHRPAELSGGQQQRLCIARAIAIRPSLILADEPTGELDSQTGRDILLLFQQIVSLGETALVVATHDQQVCDFADTVYELSDGQLHQLERGGK
jgi:putative ABC transport system ATP-binding protein